MNFFGFLNDMDNYEERKVALDEVNGLEISTVLTFDEGYETALIDKNGVHPVERYIDREDSILGHAKWCVKAEVIEEITKLGGFGGLVEDCIIKIERQ